MNIGPLRSDTDDWLVWTSGDAGPAESSSAQKESSPPSGQLEARIEGLEREIAGLRPRLAEAIEQAALALSLEQALRIELETIREEMIKREQIARQEALELQKVIAVSFGAPPTRPPRADVGTSSEEEDYAVVFNRVAGQVEQRMLEIEQKVAAADEVVQTLVRPGPTGNGNGEAKSSVRLRGPGCEQEQEPESAPAPESALIDVNRISFEQLRELGLNVTEAARLLARRDARGAYQSLEQLDELLELPPERIERLKRALRID